MLSVVELALLLLFVLALEPAKAAYTFPGYRLVQWSQGGSNFGSQRAYVNLQASASIKGAGRRIVVIGAADFATAYRKSNNSLSLGTRLEGLLIILPSANSASAMPADWLEIEHHLVHSSVPFPVYFAVEDENIREIRDSIRQTSSASDPITNAVSNTALEMLVRDAWLITATAVENEKVASDIPLVNLQGWLAGDGLTESGEALPTIAVVAHYDSFAAAPGLARGANANAAGLVSLLELSRLFSKLFLSSTRPKFNLLFLLTAAGKHNFAGARRWLSVADQRLLDTLEVVICLDSVASPQLYVHSSKIATKEARVQEVFDSFAAAGKAFNVPVEIVHKKINISAPEMSWEHEHFARKKLFALTISGQRDPHLPLGDSNLFDTPARVDFAQLERNIRVIAEGLARVMYPLLTTASEPHLVFEGSFGTNADYLKAWLEAAARESRFALFIRKDSPLLAGLEKALADGGQVEVRRSSFQLPQDTRKFFGAPSVVITASLTKSVLFEIGLLFVVLAYLFGLSVYLGGTTFVSNMKSLSAKAVRKATTKK